MMLLPLLEAIGLTPRDVLRTLFALAFGGACYLIGWHDGHATEGPPT